MTDDRRNETPNWKSHTPRGGAVELRLAARLARREIRRRPGRTLLVALLVAIPIAAMTVGAVWIRTEHQTPMQRWQQQSGNADAVVYLQKPLRPNSPIRAVFPKARFVSLGSPAIAARVLRTTSGRRSVAEIAAFSIDDPLTRGIVQITSGRAPTGPNEVFLTRKVARQLGIDAGETLHLVRPDRREVLVSGVGEFAEAYGRAALVVAPGMHRFWTDRPNEVAGGAALVDFPRPISPEAALNLLRSPVAQEAGLRFSPAIFTAPFLSSGDDTERAVRWSWVIGALALTVVGIVIAAAFATGARRQLVTLGQLAGNGADPKVLRRVLFLQGTLTGVIGALAGLGLAVVALAVLAPYVDRIFGKDLEYIVRPMDLVPIMLLGVATATIAALIPARTASRVPVLAALAGRKPLGKVPRWLPVTGAVVAAGGLALLGLSVIGARDSGENGEPNQIWILSAIVGGASVLLGACAIAPFFVSVLEPVAARARGSWRVATRSLARQRTRTSAVVSAIAATAALTIAGSALFIAGHAHKEELQYMRTDEVQVYGLGRDGGGDPPPAHFVADVEKVLPESTRFQLQVPFRPNTSWTLARVTLDEPAGKDLWVSLHDGNSINVTPGATTASPDPAGGPQPSTYAAIADRALITHYALRAPDRRVLEQRGALALANATGHATLAIVTHVPPGVAPPPGRKVTVPMVDGRKYLAVALPGLLVTPEKAKELGMTSRPSVVVLRAPKPLTDDQRNAIVDLAVDAQDALAGKDTIAYNYRFRSPSSTVDPLVVEWLLVGLALVLTLFVVAVNLALSAAETRDERDVLTVIGAGPGAMSRTNGFKAALLTVMGTVLAIPVGLLPVAVFYAAENDGTDFVFPVTIVTALVLAVPVAAGLITAGASAIALRVRPVRISTMAYD